MRGSQVGSGDGWTTCGLGHRHWGRFGAAGLLLWSGPGTAAEFVLQLRSSASHHGGTWGIPGGARDEDESAVETALRESAEEAGIASGEVRPEGTLVDDHGGWSYTTVIATAIGDPQPHPVGTESDVVRWAKPAETDQLPLHHGFARTWPQLRRLGVAPTIVVDAANTIGSRPDGWWRDRAGAVARLRGQLGDRFAPSSSSGVTDETIASWLGREFRTGVRWFPKLIMVTEGVTRDVPTSEEVELVGAPGSGDDVIVTVAADQVRENRTVIVVSADRELRTRVRAVGAAVIGPKTLLQTLLEPR